MSDLLSSTENFSTFARELNNFKIDREQIKKVNEKCGQDY